MTTGKLEKMAYSPDDVAEVCGLHINTVRHLIRTSKIPAIKLGRKYLVSKIELSKWLAGQSNQPPAAPTGTAAS